LAVRRLRERAHSEVRVNTKVASERKSAACLG
jgi:hypothetical protein